MDRPRFRHCPQCGSDRDTHDDHRRFACSGCGYSYYHNVATGAAALIVHGQALLALTRAHEPAAGTLDLPGGFVDPGESAEHALQREIGEELGLAVAADALVYQCSLANEYPYAGVRYATCDLFFRLDLDRRPVLTPNEEVAGVSWLPLADVDPARFGLDSTRAALAQLLGRAPFTDRA
ncbi:MAG: NUDIX hydrolase [Gammaproteobacteria bacterium]